MKKIESVIALQAGTTAQSVMVNGLSCLIQNNSEGAVYFKEKRADGVAATASNGYKLAAGAETPILMAAMELSIAAESDDSDVRVLIIDEY